VHAPRGVGQIEQLFLSAMTITTLNAVPASCA
jgi:hypothetical protein